MVVTEVCVHTSVAPHHPVVMVRGTAMFGRCHCSLCNSVTMAGGVQWTWRDTTRSSSAKGGDFVVVVKPVPHARFERMPPPGE